MIGKEIVQALRCCAEGECKDCAMHEDKQRCQENLLDKAADLIERLTAENAALREKHRWIPVTERMPERNGKYIVSCDDSMCSYGEGIWYSSGVVVAAEYYDGEWTWNEGGTEYSLEDIVTHWMPLPEAPEEGEKA